MPNAFAYAWYWLIGILFILYAVLDGFDLGAAILYISADKTERARILNIIGPFWDGNEVWLLAAGGALFAAFPPAYATVFSGFYLPIMLVIVALIFRATAIEFKYLGDNPHFDTLWDALFVIGSLVVPLVLGVAVGNLLKGIPLNEQGNYSGTLLALFSHYTVSTGLLAVCMFATHGSLYIAMKTTGTLRNSAVHLARITWFFYLILFIDLTIMSVLVHQHISINFLTTPRLLFVPLFGLASLATIPAFLNRSWLVGAFASSTVSIVAMIALFGLSLYPFLVPTFGYSGASLTIANASSSERTLKAMLVIVAIGLPIILVYTIYLYRVFNRPESIENDVAG